jgi:glycerol-3-phosphate acyltransferase PlsX
VPLVLVGRPEVLTGVGEVPVHPASEVIAMDEDPAQGVRRKKDASLVRAAELVRDGKASAMVSAGNTGATMASALLRMGRIKGVSRPAIAAPIPVPARKPVTLLDAGANAECQPEWLVQFAQMGSVFARHRFGIEEPTVGLLSIGEERTKGNPLVKQTHELLASAAGVTFAGNVEGRDIMAGAVDVVVTDGFTGNVVLKTLEGALAALVQALLDALASTPESAAAVDDVMPVLRPLHGRLDPDTYGGAMLLGVDGVCVISHGSSSARAIVNAIGVAEEMVEADVVGLLRTAVAAGIAR